MTGGEWGARPKRTMLYCMSRTVGSGFPKRTCANAKTESASRFNFNRDALSATAEPRKLARVWLVGVTLEPWRPGMPLMQLGVIIANRHLDLRQTLLVEDCVLRDHLVHEQQV